MSIVKNPLYSAAQYNELEEFILQGKQGALVSDLTEVSKVHLMYELLHEEKPWKLIITYDEKRAAQIFEDMQTFAKNVYLYPAKDVLFFYADIQGHRITKERMEIWRSMALEESGVVITTVEGVMDKLEDAAQFHARILHIGMEDEIDPTVLSEQLTEMGYERMAQVEGMGQFSVRGGIIDIYPLTQEWPIRIELWDESIDSMRYFDLSSQRSVENIEEIDIYPAKEKEIGGQSSFLRYFPVDHSLVFLDEPSRIYERGMAVDTEFSQAMAGRMESGQITGEEMVERISIAELFADFISPMVISLCALGHHSGHLPIRQIFSIKSRQLPSYADAFELLVQDLRHYQREKFKVALFISSRTRIDRIIQMLAEEKIFAKRAADEDAELHPGEILVVCGNIHKSFEYMDIQTVFLSEHDMEKGNSVSKKPRKKTASAAGSRISSLSQLNIGDYVIHEDYGLGIYLGLEQIERGGVLRDYVKLEYQGGDNCYVPTAKLDRIQKYAELREKPPKLSKMSGLEWAKTKARVKAAVANIAKDLVSLYSARLSGKGYVYREDGDWQREFEENFPFEETGDQLQAIEDIKRDMEEGKIMDRLICGDVGYGKTEVALRAAFKAVQEGKQVIYLVPTTILAQQHYNTFVQRMKNFPVKVGLLCRFKTAAEQRATLADFSKGFVDIIIGTHRVLSKDILPHDLGLVIVDEEQRFGVTHKEKLKRLKENVNVLTLTATPIPRTLHMSLVGIRDLSVLEEPPMDRKPIQTYVCEFHDEIVKEAIRREIGRGGQVYYVYNRVRDIESVAAHVQEIVPEAQVAFAHGQMSERELENIILDFMNGEIDILVSTTIIETGLDIPNANTMLIQDADRLGLSQLYQLRGRIGRSSRTAYAFLLYKRDKLISEEASKRLKAIREFTELGSGIKIAMRDLEIRGAGNVLGAEQHGHMQAVGYELYCKMLGMAVQALKGEETVSEEFETSIELSADAYIPAGYIRTEELKLDLYKRIASIETKEELADMQDELTDRFGDLPVSVQNLLDAALLKSLAHRVYITEVNITDREIRFVFHPEPKFNVERMPEVIEHFSPFLVFRQKGRAELCYSERNVRQSGRDMLHKAGEIVEFMNLCVMDYVIEHK